MEARWERQAWSKGRNNRTNGVLGWLQLKVDGEWTVSKRGHICAYQACPTLLWTDAQWGLYGPPSHYHYEQHAPEPTLVVPEAASAVAVAPVDLEPKSLASEAQERGAAELPAAEVGKTEAPGFLAAEPGDVGVGPAAM